MNRIRACALVFTFSTAISGLRAGDEGIYYKGIYLPPKLPEWGEQHPENKPTKYTIGDMGHEFVNGKLMFFIVREIKWNAVTHDPEYVKVPALGVKP
jgi:hypothetical protein